MSEFSDSIHFFNVSRDDLRSQLTATGAKAFVLNNGSPTAVLMSWEDKEKTRNIGSSLDFSYGGDHGVWCKFYKEGTLVGRLNVCWDGEEMEPPESPNYPGVSPDLKEILVRDYLFSDENASKIGTIADRYDFAQFEHHEAFIDELGLLMGLKNYRWQGCADLEHNMDQLLETNPDGAVN